jgi:hypothetical protein
VPWEVPVRPGETLWLTTAPDPAGGDVGGDGRWVVLPDTALVLGPA